eukprot:CAMPEP_0206384700 /NCGR_PEP_ID=MMETSP0294-20121207/14768_1 /ASSEMBLY_ACC=CAM_ASM_000327 /TAXON_ID=39354 /ORGANISM="Heterosigma akashiwo, Strain CCMP2393" /LENGTH=158 /DNA_ID=CAMNT_0053835135 /DNA_START=219 /DNA_END=692 /DNA_ORIENTATION=+
MEGSAKNTERSDRSKSRTSRQKKRIEEAHNYLAANVDPIMSQLITYLMVDQPEDVSLAMVDYLRKLQAGEPLPVIGRGSTGRAEGPGVHGAGGLAAAHEADEPAHRGPARARGALPPGAAGGDAGHGGGRRRRRQCDPADLPGQDGGRAGHLQVLDPA